MIKDWNVNELPYEDLGNFFNKYVATFDAGKPVKSNQHITKRLASILKSYLGINLDIDKTRKQVDGDRKCVINYSMTFSDILLDIFEKTLNCLGFKKVQPIIRLLILYRGFLSIGCTF